MKLYRRIITLASTLIVFGILPASFANTNQQVTHPNKTAVTMHSENSNFMGTRLAHAINKDIQKSNKNNKMVKKSGMRNNSSMTQSVH